MVKEIPIKKIKCFYGKERFDTLDREYIEKIKKKKVNNAPIILDKNYNIVDGHHRFIAIKEKGKKTIYALILNIDFEDTNILRDFQKHLKGMTPKDWTLEKTHEEFKQVIVWLSMHMK